MTGQIELTDEEEKKINSDARKFVEENEDNINWELIYDLKRENLKYQLIISKFKV